jgi:hypothetical protein
MYSLDAGFTPLIQISLKCHNMGLDLGKNEGAQYNIIVN